MPWEYKGEVIEKLPKGTFGFIYIIHYSDNTKYIGKKQTTTTKFLNPLAEPRDNHLEYINKRVKLTATELSNRTSQQVKKNVTTKVVTKELVSVETDWKRYTGSSKLTKGKTIVKKEILVFSSNKMTLTYLECKALFSVDAASNPYYVNQNILGKFYDNCLDGRIYLKERESE